MTTETNIVSNLPVPPGEYLAEVIENLGMSKGELARRMGRPLSKLSAIFSGAKAVTPETALQLERATAVPAHVWTGLETEYRLAQAKQRAQEREKTCGEEVPLVTTFRYRELVRYGFVPRATKAVDKVKALQEFFGVMSLRDVMDMPRYQVAFRQGASTGKGYAPEAVAAWLRVGEVQALRAEVSPYDSAALRTVLAEIRALTLQADPKVFMPALRARLAECGVVLVMCPHFRGTKAHGATFFMTPEKAVLMLTLRYKWADIFWFSLFHEIGHILQHAPKQVIIEDHESGKREEEADAFARDMLIAPTAWKDFAAVGGYSPGSILRFAKKQAVSPGVVVGRLQHEKKIAPYEGNEMRIRYVFEKQGSQAA
jgi:HTH-type transcriptional regulator / antitoxin HigA